MPKSFKELKELYAANLQRRERILAMYYQEKKSLTQIAKELGISKQRVWQIVDAEKYKRVK